MADREREQYLKTIAELNATVAELTKQVAELQDALNAKKRRNKFGASNMAGVYIGGVVATAVTSVLLSSWGYKQDAYNKTMWIYAGFVLLFGGFSFLRLRERVHPESADRKSGAPLSEIVRSMLKQVLCTCSPGWSAHQSH